MLRLPSGSRVRSPHLPDLDSDPDAKLTGNWGGIEDTIMVCQSCKQAPAMEHITMFHHGERKQLEFCSECADEYYKATPGMVGSRGLICLSEAYRDRLYRRLETAHPEVFDEPKDPANMTANRDTLRQFLEAALRDDHIEVSSDGLEMLLVDFACSNHFFQKQQAVQRRRSIEAQRKRSPKEGDDSSSGGRNHAD